MARRAAWLIAAVLLAPHPARAAEDHALLALPAEVMQFLGIYAAADQGFWAREGLDVKTQFIAGVGSFNAVVAGSAEFSASSGVALTRAAAHGQRMLAIANMIDKPVWSIVIAKDIAAAAGIGADCAAGGTRAAHGRAAHGDRRHQLGRARLSARHRARRRARSRRHHRGAAAAARDARRVRAPRARRLRQRPALAATGGNAGRRRRHRQPARPTIRRGSRPTARA